MNLLFGHPLRGMQSLKRPREPEFDRKRLPCTNDEPGWLRRDRGAGVSCGSTRSYIVYFNNLYSSMHYCIKATVQVHNLCADHESL